jgi:amino acid adenylation domain-containing protein
VDIESTKAPAASEAKMLHEWFQDGLQKAPDACAVTFEGQHLTYGQLNLHSNRLANHLRKLGVGPDVLVGLCVARSLDMVVALLGILKAGGAYVPLDPYFPKARLDYMVKDSRMQVLVTHREFETKLQIQPPLVVVRLDSDRDEIAMRGGEYSGLSRSHSNNLAYVVYTSGSTGKPKGVEIPHSALGNFLLSMQREPGFGATNVLLAITTLCFDIAGLEIFLPLVSGARVVIASGEDASDPVRLIRRMQESQCDVMQATPATWRALIDVGWRGSKNLKALCGGEFLRPDLARELLSRCAELWNMYGPTETTIWSTIQKVRSADGPIPIGRPILNTEVFVFDENANSVPTGTVGELYIGGAGLARGYFRRAEITRERFVHNRVDPTMRLYRTGDLGRRLSDGTFEYVGRVDHQVKVRGFRVELGEVEAVLGDHPAVKECIVSVHENSPSDAALVAYFEPQPKSSPTVNDLRAHLKAQLPDYMVPSAFVAMDKLPLTPSGKFDRKALPPPNDHIKVQDEFVAPRDALEKKLVAIWSKVLKIKRIGIRDNFFDLGGHSFAAILVLTEVRKRIGTTLPLATLFEASTIESMGEILRKDQWTPSWSSLVPIQPLGGKRPLFLVHGAEGNVLLYRQLANCLGKDQPTYGLQSKGLSGDGIVHKTIQEMAAQYIQEIKRVQPHGPYSLGGYCLGGIVALELAQQLTSSGEKVGTVIMLDTYNNSVVSLSRTLLFLSTPFRLLQNAWFHGVNLMTIRAQDRRKFSREKMDIASARLGIRLRVAFSSLHAVARRSYPDYPTHSYPHLIVKKVNDQAAARYVPEHYSGHVALIRPKGHFIGYGSPTLGWDGVIEDLQVYQLSVSPKGMLIEPFCRELAATLELCLRDA